MEIDPSTELEEAGEGSEPGAPVRSEGFPHTPTQLLMRWVSELQAATGIASLIKDFAGALPGVDEAMSFMELMKRTEVGAWQMPGPLWWKWRSLRSLQTMEFDVTVFDTAPTGHTLRLLALPGMLDKAIAKILTLRDSLGGMLGPMQAMMGGGENGLNQEALFAQLDNLKRMVIYGNNTDPFLKCYPKFLQVVLTVFKHGSGTRTKPRSCACASLNFFRLMKLSAWCKSSRSLILTRTT
jgi:arsenite-transporting ATPase